ncbi:MAG: ATP-binding protein, partial [Planctomycetota bacterium]
LAPGRRRGCGPGPTDLNNLISDTLVLLGKEMQKHRIAVETQLDADVPMAMANGNQIQSVLINLMINARQAMQEGGTLLISLTHEREQSAVAISVRDSGCGIPEEKLPHIFDSFYSTKSGPDAGGTGGTGLGLSAARQAIAAHGGKIRVESSVGVGTQFTLLIPVADAERSAA